MVSIFDTLFALAMASEDACHELLLQTGRPSACRYPFLTMIWLGLGNIDLDVLGLRHDDLMRITNVQDQVLAFLDAVTVTDAVDLEGLGESFGYA